jgi:serine/threonine protein kinase
MVLEVDAPRAAELAPQPIPRVLDELVTRCLAKDRARRPQAVDELLAALDQVLRATPWPQAKAERWWQDYRAAREAAAV